MKGFYLEDEVALMRADWQRLDRSVLLLEEKMLLYTLRKTSDDSEPWNGTDDGDFDEDDVGNGDVLKDPNGHSIIDPNTGRPYLSPPDLNIPENVAKATIASPLDLYKWFSHGGIMDYQRLGGGFNIAYRNVTNYNYGAVLAAASFPLEATLLSAGAYNQLRGRTTSEDTSYGIRQDAVNNISQGWYDYHTTWKPDK